MHILNTKLKKKVYLQFLLTKKSFLLISFIYYFIYRIQENSHSLYILCITELKNHFNLFVSE
jgi:hypothetical protein